MRKERKFWIVKEYEDDELIFESLHDERPNPYLSDCYRTVIEETTLDKVQIMTLLYACESDLEGGNYHSAIEVPRKVYDLVKEVTDEGTARRVLIRLIEQYGFMWAVGD